MERQYVGARYVPYFYEGPQGNEWQPGVAYEPLTVVTYLNTSYTSKKPVPAATGNPQANPVYWVATGQYSAQVEEYRKEVEKLKEELKLVQLNVTDYNLVGDGVTDNYNAMLSLMSTAYNLNGCTLFFPAGTYVISNTVPIPGNTNIIGEGTQSIIYFNGAVQTFGTALLCAGDNISIKNITVEYLEANKQYIKRGSQLGSIAITTRNFIPNTAALDLPNGNIKNIDIENVHGTITDPINIEAGDAGYFVTDVRVRNCYFPNAQLRVSPTDVDSLRGIAIQNCYSKAIRIGYNSGTSKGIIISGCFTNYMYINDWNIIVDNCVINGDAIQFYNTSNGQITTATAAVEILSHNFIMSNCIINNLSTLTQGISLISAAGTSSETIKIANTIVEGFTTPIYNPGAYQVQVVNSNLESTNNISYWGDFSNTEMKPNFAADTFIFNKGTVRTINWVEGIEEYTPGINTRTVKVGITEFFRGMLSCTLQLVANLKLGTVLTYDAPEMNQEFTFFWCTDDDMSLKPFTVQIQTNGDIVVTSVLNQTIPTTCNIIPIGMYYLK